MGSSKKWAAVVSAIASCVYFSVILFQVPLFRIQCRSGICTTPIEVISSHLIATKIIPSFVVKSLLYPGAIAKAIINGGDIPRGNNIFKFNSRSNFNRHSSASDLQHLEVLAGSHLSVAGAFLSLVKSRRMSFIGTLLILWGLIRERMLQESSAGGTIDSRKAVHIDTTLFLAAVSAFLSIRRDVRTLIRSFTAKPLAKTI